MSMTKTTYRPPCESGTLLDLEQPSCYLPRRCALQLIKSIFTASSRSLSKNLVDPLSSTMRPCFNTNKIYPWVYIFIRKYMTETWLHFIIIIYIRPGTTGEMYMIYHWPRTHHNCVIIHGHLELIGRFPPFFFFFLFFCFFFWNSPRATPLDGCRVHFDGLEEVTVFYISEKN